MKENINKFNEIKNSVNQKTSLREWKGKKKKKKETIVATCITKESSTLNVLTISTNQ